MNWINRERRAGKTTMLVHTAAVTYLPIVTLDKVRKEIIEGTARREGLEVKAFTLEEWTQCGYSRHEEECLVDEAATIIPTALERLLGCKVVAITTSIPMKENTRLKKEEQKETVAAGKEEEKWINAQSSS